MYLSNLTFLHTYMLMENILIASGEVNYHVTTRNELPV